MGMSKTMPLIHTLEYLFIACAFSIDPIFAGGTRAASIGIDLRNASLTRVSFIHRFSGGDTLEVNWRDIIALITLDEYRMGERRIRPRRDMKSVFV